MSDVGSFWARRRAAVKAEAEAEVRAVQEAELEVKASERAERSDTEVLDELGLPDPMQMKSGDDFSGFMARDVPEHLRRQALRTLWRSNPVLACVDGLNDYDDDYRAAAVLQEPIKTAYLVGKGMMKHVEEMERQVAERDSVQVKNYQSKEAEIVDDAPVAVAAVNNESIAAGAETPEVAVSETKQPEQDEQAAALPRRMRFRFEEAAL